MARDDDEGRSIGELLATVAGTVAAVPLVLGLVALGGVVVAGRAVFGIRHAFGSRDSRRPSQKGRPRVAAD